MATPRNVRSHNRPDDFMSVDAARPLLARTGTKTAPRERIFALGLEGRLEVRRFASRWFVSRASIERYLGEANDEHVPHARRA